MMRGGAGQDRLEGRDGDSFSDALRCGPGQPDEGRSRTRPTVSRAIASRVSQKKPPPTGRARTVGRPTSCCPTMRLPRSSRSARSWARSTPSTRMPVTRTRSRSSTVPALPTTGRSRSSATSCGRRRCSTSRSSRSYSIRVRVRDARGVAFQKALAVTVTNVQENQAPTDISLTPAAVAESLPIGTTVGSLATDPNTRRQRTAFTLVTGAGDDRQRRVHDQRLQAAHRAVLDFETKHSYSIRVRATDAGRPFRREAAHDHGHRHQRAAERRTTNGHRLGRGRVRRSRSSCRAPTRAATRCSSRRLGRATARSARSARHLRPRDAESLHGDVDFTPGRLQRLGRLQLHGQRRHATTRPPRRCRSRSTRSTTRRWRRREPHHRRGRARCRSISATWCRTSRPPTPT